MPASHRKLTCSLAVGGMCAVAAFVTIAGTTGPMPGPKKAVTAATSAQTPSLQAATCPAGTVETTDACVVNVKAPPRPAQVLAPLPAAAAEPATTDWSAPAVEPAVEPAVWVEPVPAVQPALPVLSVQPARAVQPAAAKTATRMATRPASAPRHKAPAPRAASTAPSPKVPGKRSNVPSTAAQDDGKSRAGEHGDGHGGDGHGGDHGGDGDHGDD